jgi:hypothetical protein
MRQMEHLLNKKWQRELKHLWENLPWCYFVHCKSQMELKQVQCSEKAVPNILTYGRANSSTCMCVTYSIYLSLSKAPSLTLLTCSSVRVTSFLTCCSQPELNVRTKFHRKQTYEATKNKMAPPVRKELASNWIVKVVGRRIGLQTFHTVTCIKWKWWS